MNENFSKIVRLFETSDVVLLGEAHGIHENLQFVIDLIPQLHKIGVKNIALEFSCEEMQETSDKLIDSEKYNEQISRDMLFAYNTGWPYLEYQEVHKAVWLFNRTNNANMRVLHPSYIYDWSKWNGERTEKSMKEIMHRGHYNLFRADRIGEALSKGEKVLGLFGAFHAIRHQPPFDIPVWLGTNQTLGQLLNSRYPNRLSSVCLNKSMEGEWDLHLQLSENLTPCKIDYDYLKDREFSEVVKNWPDPDWTSTPVDEEDYWMIIESRKLT